MDPIESDLTLLRGLVARELETINVYRDLAAECADPTTKSFILHVVDEEKIHIADTLRAIAVLDLDQAGLLRSGFGDGHLAGQIPVQTAGFVAAGGAGSTGNWMNSGSVAVPSALATPSTPAPDGNGNDRGELNRGSSASKNAGQPAAAEWTVGSLRGVSQVE